MKLKQAIKKLKNIQSEEGAIKVRVGSHSVDRCEFIYEQDLMFEPMIKKTQANGWTLVAPRENKSEIDVKRIKATKYLAVFDNIEADYEGDQYDDDTKIQEICVESAVAKLQSILEKYEDMEILGGRCEKIKDIKKIVYKENGVNVKIVCFILAA